MLRPFRSTCASIALVRRLHSAAVRVALSSDSTANLTPTLRTVDQQIAAMETTLKGIATKQQSQGGQQQQARQAGLRWRVGLGVAVGFSLYAWHIAARNVEETHAQTELRGQRLQVATRDESRLLPDPYVAAVVDRLSDPYQSQNRETDIAGLHFDGRVSEAQHAVDMMTCEAGSLLLLEGPSGCGKTTAVQRAMHGRCGIYLSCRGGSHASAAESIFSRLASQLGLCAVPSELSHQLPLLLERGLAAFRDHHKPSTVPVLVLDDVQDLLESVEGKRLLAWCVEASSQNLLSVLFVSCDPVASRLRAQSGYRSRLMVGHFGMHSPHDEDLLIEALTHRPTEERFTRPEATATVAAIGTHLTDLRKLQATRRSLADHSVQAALDRLVDEEKAWLHARLQQVKPRATHGPVALSLAEFLASGASPAPMPLLSARQHCLAADPHADYEVVSSVVDQLVALHVLGRDWNDGREMIHFHRPLQRAAFNTMTNDDEYRALKQAASSEPQTQPQANPH